MTTALVLAVLVLFAGQLIFRLLGITVNDLRVGGGLILLVLSISNLIFDDYRRRDPKRAVEPGSTVGVVPLGIPLIMGPAAITAVLVAQQSYGYLPTLAALLANMFLVFLVLAFGPYLARVIGPSINRAVAKVASLFLAAISVAMIRAGVVAMVKALR